MTYTSRMIVVGAVCLSAQGAQAYEITTEYRIGGEEIVSIVEPEIEIEAPLALELTLSQGQTLLIESDMLLGDCKAVLEDVQSKGNRAAAKIVIDYSADTMNGVVVTECSLRDR